MCTAFTLRSGISSFWIPLGFMWFINAGSDFLFLPLRWFRSNYLFIFFKFTWTNEAKRLRYKDIVFISASEWILLVYYLEISDLTFFTFFYLYICFLFFFFFTDWPLRSERSEKRPTAVRHWGKHRPDQRLEHRPDRRKQAKITWPL